MSIFSRLWKIGQASTNKAIDKMEKPELMLDQAIRDKDKQIREAKKSIQSCIATERQTKQQWKGEQSEKEIWEQKAQAVLKSGKEELAVKALQRAAEHEQRANALQPQCETQRAAIEELKKDIFKLEEELAEFRRNKDFIIAQSKAAEVKKQIYEAKARVSSKSAGTDDLLARMKAKAERNSSEAEAAKELAETFDGEDNLEKEFENLGTADVDSNIQKKLAEMKSNLNQPS